VVESRVQAEVDGLAGGGAAGNSLNMGGQIVATGRPLRALLTDGGEQSHDINFPRSAPGEVQISGQLEEVGFGEDDRAQGKMFCGASRRNGGSGSFF